MEGSRAGADADKAPASRPPRREEDTVNLFRNYELRTAFAPAERRRLPTTRPSTNPATTIGALALSLAQRSISQVTILVWQFLDS